MKFSRVVKMGYLTVWLSFVASCQSCFKEYPDNDSLISKEYDFVAGVIAPDSTAEFKRPYKAEVFVGKMIPAGSNNKYYIQGVLDPLLYSVLANARQWYRVYYEFDSTATVYIKQGTDSVQLAYQGHGIYRDVAGALSVQGNILYELVIKKSDGKLYTSFTTVPKDLQITSPAQDTVEIVPDSHNGDTLRIIAGYVQKPAYFVLYQKPSNFERPIYHYSFDGRILIWTFFTVSDTDTNKIDFEDITCQMRGIDENLARFDDPVDITASDEIWQYIDALEKESIRQRSNISGGKNVVGVFGSYNAATKNFTAKALWNNAGKAKISHK